MAPEPRRRHKVEVSCDSDEPRQSPDGELVIFPGNNTEPLPVSEDIVWFDPDTLAQRSEIGKQARRPGWWCPQDLSPSSDQTPCWGALAPALDPQRGQVTSLWNDPELPFVQRWSRARGLAIECSMRAAAFGLLDQMLESMVVSNLFEREPEPHRALLVTPRSGHAWWQDLVARWAHTTTPEGHPIQASHPDFATHWLMVSYDVWEQDQAQLRDWLMQGDAQKAIGFHLPGRDWAPLAAKGFAWAMDAGVKYLVAGQNQDLDALAWDPRDRITLLPKEQKDGFQLAWDKAPHSGSELHFDRASGVYYFS